MCACVYVLVLVVVVVVVGRCRFCLLMYRHSLNIDIELVLTACFTVIKTISIFGVHMAVAGDDQQQRHSDIHFDTSTSNSIADVE